MGQVALDAGGLFVSLAARATATQKEHPIAPHRMGSHASTPGAHNEVSRRPGGAGSLPRVSKAGKQLIDREIGLGDKPRSKFGAERREATPHR